MLKQLKEQVYKANLELVKRGLVLYTWGNVSGISRNDGLVAIKPSGVNYEELSPDDMVIVDLEGNIVEGSLKPSSDTPTHLELYKAFNQIGGVVHTHSYWATVFSQSGKSINPFGTTHADYFYGEIPCTRKMTASEIEGEYEKETGKVIVDTFKNRDPMSVKAALVFEHGPFTWGKDADDAVFCAVVLEYVAKMAFCTIELKGMAESVPMSGELLDRHYLRKHGKNAYYGQDKGKSTKQDTERSDRAM